MSATDLQRLTDLSAQQSGLAPGELERLAEVARRAAEATKEDLETRGPMKIQDVEEQQKGVLAIARQLSDEGRINMERGKQADQFV